MYFRHSQWTNSHCSRPAFYLYATLKIFSGVLMLMINLEFKAPANNVVSDVVSVLKNVEVVALLTACFILGMKMMIFMVVVFLVVLHA